MADIQREQASINFGEGSHDALYELEAASFWFRARNRLILWALEAHAADARKYLEIGCGTGFVLSAIEGRFPELEVFGSEALASGLERARTRVRRAQLLELDARAVSFREEFDVIGAFDVLEHIQEDEDVLAQLHGALRPAGLVVLTVPQHPALWSPADDYAFHVRRYTAPELSGKLRAAGFRVERMTSFVSLLLPLMMASRGLQKLRPRAYDPEAEMRVGGAASRALERVLDLELACIRRGLNFPAGGSLLAVARKA